MSIRPDKRVKPEVRFQGSEEQKRRNIDSHTWAYVNVNELFEWEYDKNDPWALWMDFACIVCGRVDGWASATYNCQDIMRNIEAGTDARLIPKKD